MNESKLRTIEQLKEFLNATPLVAFAASVTPADAGSQRDARAFYERLGYTVFGELPNYPPGYTRSFLHKPLRAAGCRSFDMPQPAQVVASFFALPRSAS